MSKTKALNLPKYTLCEELFNSISHGVGALFGIFATLVCIISSVQKGDATAIVSSAVYGASLVILFTMSTLYHALAPNRAKYVFRKIDHCSIFLLIAGTYTPYTLVAMRGAVGWMLFACVWGGAVLGIVFNAINVEKFKVLSMIAYIAMGWCVIFAFGELWNSIEPMGVWLLLFGGVLYTLGAAFYGIGRKKFFMHSIFHFFVLLGAVLHFLSIYFYVI